MTKLKVSVPKINKQLAIKTAVAVVTVLVLVGLVSAVSAHWQKQKQIKSAQDSAQQAQEQKAAKVTADKLDHAEKVELAYNKVYAECTKGSNIYENVLTPSQKKLNLKSQPVCGTAVPAL